MQPQHDISWMRELNCFQLSRDSPALYDLCNGSLRTKQNRIEIYNEQRSKKWAWVCSALPFPSFEGGRGMQYTVMYRNAMMNVARGEKEEEETEWRLSCMQHVWAWLIWEMYGRSAFTPIKAAAAAAGAAATRAVCAHKCKVQTLLYAH